MDKLAFVNCTGETFTPTASGAISTWLWEVLQAARKDDVEPLVVTRSAKAEPWNWPNKVLISYPYPKTLSIKGAARFYNLERRLMGWAHVHQGAYFRLVADAIRSAASVRATLLLHNDIEMAVWLREAFPNAAIIHLAHNDNPCDRRFRGRFAQCVNRALAVSGACARWNADYYQLPVETLYNGVNTEMFHPASAPPAGDTVVNFVGTTDRRKGPDILLEACLLVSKKTRKFSVQLLGRNFYDHHQEDDFQQHLRELIGKLENSGIAVRRPGWITRPSLPGELRRAHIHVTTSRWNEPFGLTTVEAMACGLATVASATGGTPEIVGDAGLLFERENVEQLAAHLERLVLDEPLRREYAIKARKRAEEFTWDRTWQKIKAMLPAQ